VFDDLLDDELDKAQAKSDNKAELAVGIDLGTTNSVVALVVDGKPVVVRDAGGVGLHPSVVAWLPSRARVVGQEARRRAIIDPANTVASAKRIIGQPFSSFAVQEAVRHVLYKVEQGPNQEPLIVTREGKLPVPQVSSYVLGHLKRLAEQHAGRPVTAAVITVPANFTDGQRAATRRAAELAGLEVLRILNEPTAAAVAYGQVRPANQRIAIFDLGGGTFDCTVLAVRGGIYEVLATGGDPFLGGDDFDRVLAERLAADLLEQHRVDAAGDAGTLARLRGAAEEIKHQLSIDDEVEGTIHEIGYGPGGAPLSLDFHITRAQVEALIAPMVDRALVLTEQVLSDAGLSAKNIDEVILVGGSTRVPMVARRVGEQFGRKPRLDLDPMEVVAMGAAIQAASLAAPGSTATANVLLDITSHSLRIATAGGFSRALIKKNTPIPAEGVATFAPARDEQTQVKVLVCQGEADRYDDNVPLGELVLDGLPAGHRGDIKLEVTFTIDADGILQVAAKELGSGIAARATLDALGRASEPQEAPAEG
jgi:molecular chaperone DnaK